MDLQSFFSGLDTLYRTGRARQAEEYLSAGLARARAEEDHSASVSIANELGGLYRVRGRFPEGVACFQSALRCLEGSPFDGTEGHAATLLNYATLLTAMGDLSGAAERFTETLGMWDALGFPDRGRAAALYNNLAGLRLRQKQYREALSCIKQALALLRDIPNSDDEQGVSHTVCAQIQMQTGESIQALRELELAEKAFSRCPDASPIHRAAAAQCRGELGILEQNWEAALEAYCRAEELIRAGNGDDSSIEQLHRRQALCRQNLCCTPEEGGTAL